MTCLNGLVADGISLEPMDGDGWCRGEEYQKYSQTYLFVTLCNEVAKALEKEFPEKYIGILSYNKQSFPPTIRVHKTCMFFLRLLLIIAEIQLKSSLRNGLRKWTTLTLACTITGMFQYGIVVGSEQKVKEFLHKGYLSEIL